MPNTDFAMATHAAIRDRSLSTLYRSRNSSSTQQFFVARQVFSMSWRARSHGGFAPLTRAGVGLRE